MAEDAVLTVYEKPTGTTRPEMLQHPVVEKGDRAVLARPVENVRELLRASPAAG